MRILFVTREKLLPADGREGEAERNIIAKMVSRGHELTVHAPLDIGEEEIKRVETKHNLRLVKIHSPTDRAFGTLVFCAMSSIALTIVLMKERYDAIFLSNCPLIIPTKIIGRFRGGIFVLYLSDFMAGQTSKAGDKPGLPGKALFYLERKAASLFDIVFASTYQMKMLLIAGGCTPSRLHVTYDGVNTDRFRLESVSDKDVGWIKTECGIERKIILFNSPVEPHTPETIKTVVEEVLKKRNDVTFIMAGEGRRYSDLKSGMKSENVKFVGPLPYGLSPAYIAAANAGLVLGGGGFKQEYKVPSELLEYLAVGLPVAAMESRTVRDQFGEHDFIRMSGSPQDLAAALTELVDHPKSDDAANLLRERYSWETVSTEIAEAVEAKLEKNRQNRRF